MPGYAGSWKLIFEAWPNESKFRVTLETTQEVLSCTNARQVKYHPPAWYHDARHAFLCMPADASDASAHMRLLLSIWIFRGGYRQQLVCWCKSKQIQIGKTLDT